MRREVDMKPISTAQTMPAWSGVQKPLEARTPRHAAGLVVGHDCSQLPDGIDDVLDGSTEGETRVVARRERKLVDNLATSRKNSLIGWNAGLEYKRTAFTVDIEKGMLLGQAGAP